jgi:predicted transcriptional regulator
MTKQAVIDSLNDMPVEFALDDFMERLIVIEKIDKALADVEAGHTLSHEEAMKEIEKCEIGLNFDRYEL